MKLSDINDILRKPEIHELMLEICTGSERFASVYTSGLRFHRPLAVADAERLVREIKRHCGMDIGDAVPQERDYRLDEWTVNVISCPQLSGEIIVLRRPPDGDHLAQPVVPAGGLVTSK